MRMRDAAAALSLVRQAPVADAVSAQTVDVTGLVFEAGGKQLINGVDLTIAPGPVTMIMGPNGAGKSLLLRLLHGLLTPTAGNVSWNGERAGDETRKRQAMVFQKPVLLRRSVAANVDFVLKLKNGRNRAERIERRDALLHAVGLADHARQPARLLSGGEQQRLALIRALAAEPDVLFLDEPTASLDPASVLMIENAVSEAHLRGMKIIFVTHDVGQVKRIGGEVVFMAKGRVTEQTQASSFASAPRSKEAAAYLNGRLVI